MTRRIGKFSVLAYLAVLIICPTAHSAVEATVDRQQVVLGDTLRLTISATEDDEDLGNADLSPLQSDFDILQRSTRSSTSIINGKRSHNRELVLEITPRNTGNLRIPPLRVGARSTDPIEVIVEEAPQVDPGGETVLFQAELDRESVYVQGQLVLTLRLEQAINLDNRSISELQLPDAFVLPLEQKSFQRTMNGRPWLVHEVRYAIFPEQSGTLQIPAQTFTARESTPRRSLFDTGGRGRLVHRETPAINVEVLPRPDNYPAGATWLPARELVLQETWSSDPGKLRVGESVTRTVQLRGEGLQGAQLPPVILPQVEGLKYYPDQPSINDEEVASGLLGSRRDSTAILPTGPGQLEIPELRIPWWDIDSGELRFAILPARTLTIAAAENLDRYTAPATPQSTQSAPVAGAVRGSPSALGWQIATLTCGLGWGVTLLLLLHSKRRRDTEKDADDPKPTARRAFKRLLAACASHQAAPARRAVLQWSAARAGNRQMHSLQQAADFFADDELSEELLQLERSLYSSAHPEWNGVRLAAIARRLQKEAPAKPRTGSDSLALYPSMGQT